MNEYDRIRQLKDINYGATIDKETFRADLIESNIYDDLWGMDSNFLEDFEVFETNTYDKPVIVGTIIGFFSLCSVLTFIMILMS